MGKHLIVVGVFKEEIRAESAIAELRDAGFDNDQVEYSGRSSKREMNQTLENLVNMGMSEEEVLYYKSELEIGRSIVLVQHQGRRNETLAILLLNGARNHKYLKKSESVNMEPSNTSTPSSVGFSDQMDSKDSSANSSLSSTTRNDKEQLKEDELTSLRKLLEREGLDHLI
jgi:hypothetical protein